jgi:hypothetical protein
MDFIYWILFGLKLVACSSFSFMDAYRNEMYEYSNQLYDKYLKYTVESYALSALTYYSACKNNASRNATIVYSCHPAVTDTVDLCVYSYRMVCAYYREHPIEPFHARWISQNHLVMIGIEQPAYTLKNVEKYNLLHHIDSRFSAHIFLRNFGMDSFALSQMQLNCVYNEKLLYARFNDIYVSRVQSSDSIILRSIDDFTRPSKVAFLSVSVSINQKKYNVDMDKKWMYVNNHLFSKTFLKRYFDYHNIKVRFTNDYVVNLMDNNIHMFQLKPGEYIQLNANDYTMKNTLK